MSWCRVPIWGVLVSSVAYRGSVLGCLRCRSVLSFHYTSAAATLLCKGASRLRLRTTVSAPPTSNMVGCPIAGWSIDWLTVRIAHCGDRGLGSAAVDTVPLDCARSHWIADRHPCPTDTTADYTGTSVGTNLLRPRTECSQPFSPVTIFFSTRLLALAPILFLFNILHQSHLRVRKRPRSGQSPV